jgi:hypothetical protein
MWSDYGWCENVTIHSKSRESARNVIKACEIQVNRKELLSPLTLATEKAFKYTGFINGYNKRIRQGSKPGKHRTRLMKGKST